MDIKSLSIFALFFINFIISFNLSSSSKVLSLFDTSPIDFSIEGKLDLRIFMPFIPFSAPVYPLSNSSVASGKFSLAFFKSCIVLSATTIKSLRTLFIAGTILGLKSSIICFSIESIPLALFFSLF